MSLVLIESDASLRALLHCLIARTDQPIFDFVSVAEAFPLLQASTVVLTILCDDSLPEQLHLLGQPPFPQAHRYIVLPHPLTTQLLHIQRRLDRLLERAQRHALAITQLSNDVTLAQWERIVAFLPPQHAIGRPRVDQRQTLNGVLYVLHMGTAWSTMPKHYGSYVTCWRRWHQWQHDGTWQRIQTVLTAPLD